MNLTKSFQFTIAKAQKHKGPTPIDIQTPGGTMLCNPGDTIITDEHGHNWVFTTQNCIDFLTDVYRNN